MTNCQGCGADISKRRLAKWCLKCYSQHKRPGTLTPAQEQVVRSLAKTVPQAVIARRIKTDKRNLSVWAKKNNVDIKHNWFYEEQVVKKVCAMYNERGLKETQEAFPDVKVYCIVHKKFSRHRKYLRPRQSRWTDEQLIELAKMGGLISYKDQARFFDRPRAGVQSINEAWRKRFSTSSFNVNGLTTQEVSRVVRVKNTVVPIEVSYLNKKTDTYQMRKLYLWADLEHNLRDDVPEFIKSAISTLADYQRWLFQTNDVRQAVLNMIKERQHGERV